MAKEDDTVDLPNEAANSFVPAVFARSPEEAVVYCELLSDHEIPAVVGDKDSLSGSPSRPRNEMTHGLPVLVPEPLLDEAGEVIASRDEAEDLLSVNDDDPDEDYDDEDDHFGFTEIEDDDVLGGSGDVFDDDDED